MNGLSNTQAAGDGAAKAWWVWILLVVFAGLFASFITADVLTADSDNYYSKHAKYAGVLLCLLLVMSIGRHGHSGPDRVLVQFAFVGIAAADFVIGMLGRFLPGLALFLLVQVLLFARHVRGFRFLKEDLVSLGLFLGTGGLVFAAAYGSLAGAGLAVPAAIYALVLFLGLWAAERTRAWGFYPPASARLILVAMSLFVLCDWNTALFNALRENGPVLFRGHVPVPAAVESPEAAATVSVLEAVPYTLRQTLGIFVWIFYFPCLVLLALSAFRPGFLSSVLPRKV